MNERLENIKLEDLPYLERDLNFSQKVSKQRFFTTFPSQVSSLPRFLSSGLVGVSALWRSTLPRRVHLAKAPGTGAGTCHGAAAQ